MKLCYFCAQRKAHSCGLCKACYERRRTTGSLDYKVRALHMTEEEAFFDQVQEENGHWLWTGARDKDTGYGRFGYKKNVATLAHRWSFTFLIGEIPPGLVLDHECRIRHCVYPWHLDPVTHAVNIARGEHPSALYAGKTHCRNNHEYTPENTYVWRGKRQCVSCRAYHNRNRKKKPV